MLIQSVKHALFWGSICFLLSLVLATSPNIPSGETIEQWAWFGKAVLISASCLIVACLLQTLAKADWRDILFFRFFHIYVAWSLVFLGAIEAIWGGCQLYGLSASGHSRYVLTGSFFNPGPYGGYLAITLPICLHMYLCIPSWKEISTYYKVEKILAIITGGLILCVLPATMSRSAWIAASVSCGWVVYMHRNKLQWQISWLRYKKRYLVYGLGIVVAALLSAVAIFLLKPDSALGRLFIWKMTCRAIAKYPFGCDKGFAYGYSEVQSNYFAKDIFYTWEERVAGSPEYAFNEYLDFSLENGITTCAILLLIISGCLWVGIKLNRYGICGGIISLLIFSFSSYPLHIPAFLVTGMCLLLACGIGDIIWKPFVMCVTLLVWTTGYTDDWEKEREACRNWTNARILYYSGAYVAANKVYEKFRSSLQKKGMFLFEYGHSLHKSGHYEESNKYLNQSKLYNTDPMILNIMGQNYQILGYYMCAEKCYLASIARLPGRIYPYYLLAKLYTEPKFQNRKKFEEMKRIVLTKKPKVHSTAIEEIKLELGDIKLLELEKDELKLNHNNGSK